MPHRLSEKIKSRMDETLGQIIRSNVTTDAKRRERIDGMMPIIEQLFSEGFFQFYMAKTDEQRDNAMISQFLCPSWETEVSQNQLAILRRIFGDCKDNGNREIAKASEKTVKVYLNVGHDVYDNRFYYVKQLEDNAPCKIVETVEHKLVCEVK